VLADADEADGPDVVLVTGLSGVGKSQLVAYWVKHHVRDRFSDGCFYVDLGELRRDGAVDTGAVVADFLRALNVDKDRIPAGLGERAALFRSVTAGRRVLVMVDDAHHAAEIRPLLPAHGLVVVTSRRRIPGLILDGAVTLTVDPLEGEAGVRLVRSWRESADVEAAGELVRLCGGLPLLMRAAGRWLVERPDMDLADAVRLLSEGRVEILDNVVDSVLNVLPDHTRHVYALLGHYPGTTFTSATLTAAGGRDVDAALADLLSAHLVAPASRRGYFVLQDLVRQHALDRAQRDPAADRAGVLRAVTDFFRVRAASADHLFLGERYRLQDPPVEPLADPPFTTGAEAIDWLDAERPNLLAVLRSAADEGWHDDVWQLCESLWALYHSRKHFADWIEAQQLGVQAAQWEGRMDVEVRMRNQLARAYYELGELGPADEQIEQALPLLESVTDPRLNGMIWETTGLIALVRSRSDDAVSLFTRARDANAEQGDTHGIVVQTYNLAQALLAARRFDEALDALARAEQIADSSGDAGMRSRIALVQGRVYRAAGRLDHALDAFALAAQWAAERRQLDKLEQALLLVRALADEDGDPRLQAAASRRLRELRAHVGVEEP
jgi:tetratricopeptide (TPR) repeat protein